MHAAGHDIDREIEQASISSCSSRERHLCSAMALMLHSGVALPQAPVSQSGSDTASIIESGEHLSALQATGPGLREPE